MMFQKRHYEAIVTVLRNNYMDSAQEGVDWYDANVLANRMADMFKADNSRFNRERFLDALHPTHNVDEVQLDAKNGDTENPPNDFC